MTTGYFLSEVRTCSSTLSSSSPANPQNNHYPPPHASALFHVHPFHHPFRQKHSLSEDEKGSCLSPHMSPPTPGPAARLVIPPCCIPSLNYNRIIGIRHKRRTPHPERHEEAESGNCRHERTPTMLPLPSEQGASWQA